MEPALTFKQLAKLTSKMYFESICERRNYFENVYGNKYAIIEFWKSLILNYTLT